MQMGTAKNELEPVNEPQVSPWSVSSPMYLMARRFTFGLIRTLSTTDTENVNSITLLKVHQVVILICSILLMIVLLQIPTILYYANPPSFGVSSFADGLNVDINFKDCTVSIIPYVVYYIMYTVHANSVSFCEPISNCDL